MMSEFAEPFDTIQKAIIGRCSAAGLTVYPYLSLSPTVGSGYLHFNQPRPEQMRADQGETRIGLVVYQLHVYESLLNDPLEAQKRTSMVCARVYKAFADASLGGKVRDARIDQMTVDAVQLAQGDKPAMLVDATLHVRPAPHTQPA